MTTRCRNAKPDKRLRTRVDDSNDKVEACARAPLVATVLPTWDFSLTITPLAHCPEAGNWAYAAIDSNKLMNPKLQRFQQTDIRGVSK